MTGTTLALVVALVALAALTVSSVRARRALREKEATYRTLVDHAPEALVILDAQTGRFVDTNQRACELFGRSREELLELGPPAVSPAQQPNGEASGDAARRFVGRALEGEAPVFEWWHRHASGELVPCEIRLVRLPSRERTLVRGSIVDISDRKAAEERARALEAQLRQSSKLEAIGQLTGGVAHDFNNLLTVAMGNLELLKSDLRKGSERHALASEASAALVRGAQLTARLLAFSRRQPLRPESVDVEKLVAGMTGLLRRTLGETIEIEESIDPELWPCRTDRAQLENAIVNLAINARDAMRSGGRLRISARNRVANSAEMETWFDDAGAPGEGPTVPASREFVEIVVRDDGTGMSTETAARAFEPFFTTKEVGEGSGLGLSTVYGFVRQSGGHVGLDTAPGRGTAVILRLPRAVEEPAAAVSEREGPLPLPKGPIPRGRVLVVEDDEAVRRVGVAFLENMGYLCVPVVDAVEALEVLEEDTAFDVLFTDVVLPRGIDGVELARRVRERLPRISIVFCSGYNEQMAGNSHEIRELGPIVRKPYTGKDLTRVL